MDYEIHYPYPVRYPCGISTQITLQEGKPEREWVTLRSERRYDPYGNISLEANLGVVPSATRSCAPCTAPAGTVSGACGEACTGDEMYVATEYIEPGPETSGSWNLGAAFRRRRYSAANPEDLTRPAEGARFSETRIYYDGAAFVGRPSGLTRGLVRRVCVRVGASAAPNCAGAGWIQPTRVDHDRHGNIVSVLDPLGTPGDFSGHRRAIRYGDNGLKPSLVTLYLSRDGEPYTLSRSIDYDPIFDKPWRIGRWQLTGATVRSTEAVTRVAYDDFGRLSRVAAPGDRLETPTQEFVYELGEPVSLIAIKQRSKSGEEQDLETVRCIDGLGRTLQSRTRLDHGLYQVTGFHEVNPQGSPVRIYQPYQGGRDCEREPPQDVPFTRAFYDGAGRPLRITEPDAVVYGSASQTRFDYAPLASTTFDPEDNNPKNEAAYHTPHRRRVDGLGRLIALERLLSVGGQLGTVRALWDELGNLAGYLDPKQNRRQQTFDLIGRVLEVHDPNAGRTRFEYDAAGNLLTRTDPRGKTLQTRYDGANRPLERFDPEARAETLERRWYDFAPDCKACTHAEGRLAQARYPLDDPGSFGRDEFGYDTRGRGVLFARTLEGQRFPIATTFDNAGRVTAQRYPDGRLLTMGYDGASRPTGIQGVLDNVRYNARGQLASVQFANGVTTSYGYDARQRLITRIARGVEGSLLQGLSYRQDRTGNLLAVTNLLTASGDPVDSSVRYRHDAWYRMLQADFSVPREELEVRFDALDNMTRKTSSLYQGSAAHVGAYRYDSAKPNSLDSAGHSPLRHDAAGQLIERGDLSLEWDHRGRLLKAHAHNGKRARYAYDTGDNRVVERHNQSVSYYIGPNFEVRDGICVLHVRLGDKRVARLSSSTLTTLVLDDRNNNGTLDAGDAWLSRNLPRAAGSALHASARRLLLEAEGPSLFLHQGPLGSITLATAMDGSIRGKAAFYPTGNARRIQGYLGSYGFTGQRRDRTSSLIHFRFRDLDPHTGRWTRPDPLFAVATPNGLHAAGEATSPYAYVAGGFSSRLDPQGLASARYRGGRLGGYFKRRRDRARLQTLYRYADSQQRHTQLGRAQDADSLFAAMGRVRMPRSGVRFEKQGNCALCAMAMDRSARTGEGMKVPLASAAMYSERAHRFAYKTPGEALSKLRTYLEAPDLNGTAIVAFTQFGGYSHVLNAFLTNDGVLLLDAQAGRAFSSKHVAFFRTMTIYDSSAKLGPSTFPSQGLRLHGADEWAWYAKREL